MLALKRRYRFKKLHFPSIILVACLVQINTFAQKKNGSYQYHIHRASSAIKIDAVIDESAWKDAEIAKDFFMVLPMDTSFAKAFTEVLMAYDDHNLYLVAECFQAVAGPNYVESLRNDWSFGKNDN